MAPLPLTDDRAKHHMFCSAGGWPCPLGCEKWTRCAVKFFPALKDPQFVCPTCQGGPCTLSTLP